MWNQRLLLKVQNNERICAFELELLPRSGGTSLSQVVAVHRENPALDLESKQNLSQRHDQMKEID